MWQLLTMQCFSRNSGTSSLTFLRMDSFSAVSFARSWCAICGSFPIETSFFNWIASERISAKLNSIELPSFILCCWRCALHAIPKIENFAAGLRGISQMQVGQRGARYMHVRACFEVLNVSRVQVFLAVDSMYHGFTSFFCCLPTCVCRKIFQKSSENLVHSAFIFFAIPAMCPRRFSNSAQGGNIFSASRKF